MIGGGPANYRSASRPDGAKWEDVLEEMRFHRRGVGKPLLEYVSDPLMIPGIG